MALARWQETIQDNNGDVVPSATITVRIEGVGTPLASLFSDRDGLVAKANPFTADSEGFAFFHVPGGAYQIEIDDGSTTRTLRYVGVGLATERDSQPVGVSYRFDSGTTNADPGNGNFRLNNADPSLATEVIFSDEDVFGLSQAAWLNNLDNAGVSNDRGIIYLRSTDSAAIFVAKISGDVIVEGGPVTHYRVPVSPVMAATLAATFVSGLVFGAQFSPRGNDGVLSAIGSTTVGNVVVFNTTDGSEVTAADDGESPANLIIIGTIAGIRAATRGHSVHAGLLRDAAANVALTDAATVAINWESGINFTLELTANRVLGNPTNGIPGTFRTVLVDGNDATARTLTFGNQYGGDVPTLTDITSTKKYLLTLYCKSATQFLVTAIDGSDA